MAKEAPTRTGAMAPVRVLGREARSQARGELVRTSGQEDRPAQTGLFVVAFPILDGEGIVGVEHGTKAATVVVLVSSVVVITIIIIVEPYPIALAVDGLTHILVAVLVSEGLETVGLAIVGRKGVLVAILHDVEGIASGEVVADVVVVATHFGNLCAHLDAEEEVAKTILAIDDAVVVGVVGTKAVDVALAGDLSEVLSVGGLGDSAGEVSDVVNKCGIVLTWNLWVFVEPCELCMERECECCSEHQKDDFFHKKVSLSLLHA